MTIFCYGEVFLEETNIATIQAAIQLIKRKAKKLRREEVAILRSQS